MYTVNERYTLYILFQYKCSSQVEKMKRDEKKEYTI